MALCTFAVWLAYYLRLGVLLPLDGKPTLAVAVSICLAVPMFVIFGLYRAVALCRSGEAVWATVRLRQLWHHLCLDLHGLWDRQHPRTVGIIQPLLLFAMVFVARQRQLLAGRRLSQATIRPAPSDRTMIYGAGLSGQQRRCAAIADGGGMKVIGFIDDDRALHGRTIGGLGL